MNREIKFRGISSSNRKWIYGNYAIMDDLPAIIEGSIEFIDGSELRSYSWDYVIPETVGQFTGLYDKNGKEIYEGDIIKSPSNNIVAVQFGRKEHIVKNKELRMFESYSCYGWTIINIKNGIIDFLDNSILKGEVIGNIHDNIDLLNKEL